MYNNINYQNDEYLVAHYKDSEEYAAELISRYTKVIWIKAHSMSSIYIETDDLIQEGMLGLLNAIKTYDQHKSKFSTYADRCISNKMTSAIIKNNFPSILVDEIIDYKNKSDNDTPESILMEKENFIELDDKVSTYLSAKEMQIFKLFLNGSTYNQVAHQLNISLKTVDNALQRIRRKLKTVWRANN